MQKYIYDGNNSGNVESSALWRGAVELSSLS